MGDPAKVFEVKTKEQTYRVCFNNRAFREAEAKLGYPLNENRKGIRDLTVMLWGGLLEHHPEVTLEKVDAILDEVGYDVVGPIVAEASTAAPPFGPRIGSES